MSAIPTTGGEIRFPIDRDGLNDYLTSDTWNIRRSHVTLNIPRGVTLRSTAVTTHGQTVSFAEGTIYGGDDANRLENVAVVGGGTVRNTSSGTNENVIGFSRVKHFACIGMNIPAANRKAITAQVGVEGGRILRNNIGTCGHAAISIETGEGTTADGYLEILGNHIESAGDTAIQVVGTNSPATDFFSVSIDDNIVESAATDGIYCFRVKGLKLGSGNEVWSAGQRGIRVSTCENVRIDGGLVKTAGYDGVRVASCTGTVHIGPVVVEDANTSASTYSAISLDTNTAKVQMFSPKVGGAGFVYSIISTADYELFGGILATGTSGYFGTTTPSYHDVYLDGALRTSRRIPNTALTGASLSAANGVEYITLTNAAPTNVTDITGTRLGQEVRVVCADGNSTFKDGTGNLRLNGDFAAPDQAVLTLLSNGTQLHEQGRSPNT